MKIFENEDIIFVKENNNITYLQFKILNKYKDKINHCITTRNGGVSSGVYESLNFRTTGFDSKENVLKNLELVCNSLEIKQDNVFKGKQAHTDNILIIDKDNKEKYKFTNLCTDEIDGYVTNEKDINTLVTTADCNPIIIYDPINNVVSNVHSGWKGTLKKISLKAVNIMHEKFNSNYEDLIVCIGPSIRKCCFTSMEEEFKNKFLEVFKDEENYVTKDKEGRYHIDLIYLITNDLIRNKVKKENIKVANICTCCESKDFFSYRKATQNMESDYGTFATIAGLK